jgi:predicted XRE-type DNA-binding protein
MAKKTSTKKRRAEIAKTPRSRRRRDAIPRTQIAKEVQRQIDRFGLTREMAAFVVGDAATQISRLMNGYVEEFSVDRLAKMLTKLGSDVTVSIQHARKLGRRGKIKIKVLR